MELRTVNSALICVELETETLLTVILGLLKAREAPEEKPVPVRTMLT